MKNLSLPNKLLYLSNIIFTILWFCAFLCPYINPKTFSLSPILAIGYPLLLFIHLFFLLYWLLQLKKASYISLIVLLASYFFCIPVYKTKGKFKALAKDNSFSIMSFNTQLSYYSGGQKNQVQENQTNIIHFLNQENPDVLCLQEARKGISDHLNYQYKSVFRYNQIYSKYEIISSKEIEFDEPSSNNSSYADLVVHKDTIRIYNLHLESMHIANEEYQLFKEWNDELLDEQLQDKTQKLSNKINRATSIRIDQVRNIIESIENNPYPAVICGDFNDVPQSYVYRILNKGHKDAFLDAGKGFGTTFRQFFFPFRIDYILIDKLLSAYNFNVLNKNLSDHQAIRCDIEF